MNFPSDKPQLSLQAYYGFNSALLDTDDIEDYTIQQVFERGTSSDISEVLRVYGETSVRDAIKQADNLSLRAVKLAKTVLNLEDNDFACQASPSTILIKPYQPHQSNAGRRVRSSFSSRLVKA